ncbi:MAG: carboxymethylenebutenolidase [Actinomycetota bacterium]|jgi:carboxymethylenebutenolidase
MKLTNGWETVDGVTGPMHVYTSRSSAATGPLPAVLVLQEIWGVDEHISDVADRIASAGYVAVSPDLYSIGGERPEAIGAERVEALKTFMDTMPPGAWQDNDARAAALAKLPDAEAATVSETMTTLFSQFANMETFIGELRGVVEWVRNRDECDGRVGAIGFCMGGGMAARLACDEPNLRGAVGFYGAAPTAEQIANLHCAVLCLHGEQDTRLVNTIADFQNAADAAAKSYEAVVYPDAPHAFFNDTRSSYRPDAARPAWARTLSFLNEHVAS